MPGTGLIIAPSADDNVQETLAQGCWTPVARFGPPATRQPLERDNGERFAAKLNGSDGSRFQVTLEEEVLGEVSWSQFGEHNVHNALAAIAAARHAGVAPAVAIDALSSFDGVARRMDLIAEINGIAVYDDFAHHPTAIRKTLQGLRKRVGNEEIIAVIEPRSHTMSLGTLREELKTCCAPADQVFWFRGENIKWDLTEVVQGCMVPAHQHDNLERLMTALIKLPRNPDKTRHIVIMSNGGFGGIYEKLPQRLSEG